MNQFDEQTAVWIPIMTILNTSELREYSKMQEDLMGYWKKIASYFNVDFYGFVLNKDSYIYPNFWNRKKIHL